jgi:hypothetical protein
LRRRGISILAGDALRAGAGDFPLDLAGDSPRTTSSLSAAKNPCFLSFSISRNAAATASAAAAKKWRSAYVAKQIEFFCFKRRAWREGESAVRRGRSGVEEGWREWGKCVAAPRALVLE